jgi:hypothetical protein
VSEKESPTLFLIQEISTNLENVRKDLQTLNENDEVYYLLSSSLSDLNRVRDIIEEMETEFDHAEEKFGLCNS